MHREPLELRLRRTSRNEALSRAAQLVGEGQVSPVVSPAPAPEPAPPQSAAPGVLDEAFADLSATLSVTPSNEANGSTGTPEMVAQITSQLEQLDAHRDRLAGLLAGMDSV